MDRIDEEKGTERATREAAKMLVGEENIDENTIFNNRLQEIEQKHIEYFRGRKSVDGQDEHDRLHHHHILTNDQGKVKFGFREDSDLPQNIKDDCNRAFYEVWGT